MWRKTDAVGYEGWRRAQENTRGRKVDVRPLLDAQDARRFGVFLRGVIKSRVFSPRGAHLSPAAQRSVRKTTGFSDSGFIWWVFEPQKRGFDGVAGDICEGLTILIWKKKNLLDCLKKKTTTDYNP